MTLTSTPRRKPILVFDNALTFTALCANLLASLPYFIERDPTAGILYTSGALTMADPWAGATCCVARVEWVCRASRVVAHAGGGKESDVVRPLCDEDAVASYNTESFFYLF